MKTNIVVIAHNLRSCHNVGSLLRTCEGIKVEKVILSGYTPYPKVENDKRMPHIASKIDKQIKKTALGAESTQRWEKVDEITPVLNKLGAEGYVICALEQAEDSKPLPEFNVPDKVACVIGNEVEGLEKEVLKQADYVLEIPMLGTKESFNVVQAAAMALYHFRFFR